MIDLRWFMRDLKQFLRFCEALNSTKNDSIFGTEIVRMVLHEFWNGCYNKLFYGCFVPYCIGLVTFLLLVHKVFGAHEFDPDKEQPSIIIEVFVSLLCIGYQIFQEIVAFSGADSVRAHFNAWWNFNDLFWMTLSPFIVIASTRNEYPIQRETLVTMSALVAFSMMIKLFDWMRLFKNTAHYVTLIGETLSDSASFIIILIANLMLFGVPMSIIDLNRDEENAIIQGDFKNWVINDFLNQYTLALGDWDDGNFDSGNQIALVYFFFALSTFFSIILMLNMLIAIMGDTYEKIIENRDVNEVKTLLQLMGECATNIQVFNLT